MLNVSIHIIPKFDCLMRFFEDENEIFSLNTLGCLSDEIDLKVEDLKNFNVKLYPFNKKNEIENIAYTANFKVVHDKLICENKQVSVFYLPENHIVIKFNPINLKSQAFEKVDKVENICNSIKTLKILPTLNKKGEVEVYEINGDRANFKEKYYVSLLNKRTNNNIEILKFLQFFEDLKYGSEDDIKERFSPNLSDRLSEQTMNRFFGEFDDILMVNFYNEPAIALLNEKNKTARVFTATFDKGLIDNIIEIE